MSKTIIKPSNIKDAGNGVFLTKDIKKNEVICFYGFDKIVDMDTVLDKETNEYCFNDAFDTGKKYIGSQKYKNDIEVAQFINDFSKFDTSNLRCLGDLIPYMKRSLSQMNCVLYGEKGKVLCVALRDLKKNTELYVHYGIGYWLEGQSELTTTVMDNAIQIYSNKIEQKYGKPIIDVMTFDRGVGIEIIKILQKHKSLRLYKK